MFHHVSFGGDFQGPAAKYCALRLVRTRSQALKMVAKDELQHSIDKKLVKHFRSTFDTRLFNTLFCSELELFAAKEVGTVHLLCRGTNPCYTLIPKFLLEFLSLGVETSQ